MVRDRSSESLEALVVAARQLQDAGTVDDLLQQIVDMAVASIAGCAHAGVSTERDGRPSSPVVSDPAVLAIDTLQYTLDTGPCLQAMRGSEVFIDAPDLEHDPRFEPFGDAAAKGGCRAVLAHRLYVDSETLGSLNLYADRPHAYSDDDRRASVILSSLASLALNMVRLEVDGDGLREAVQSRDVIGQAKGILMEREDLSAEEAFAELRGSSQVENVKLREIAQRLVDDRVSRSSSRGSWCAG
jgi:GAF domain-containing protein